MSPQHSKTVLVLSLADWLSATRTRKSSISYAAAGHEVTFLALQQVGSSGQRADAGTTRERSVTIHHVAVRPPSQMRTTLGQLLNVLFSYVPAFWRLVSTAMRRPAAVVHVTGVPIIPVALIHHWRYRSKIVVDINERPAAVSAAGSLFGMVSRFEPFLIRRIAHRATLVTVVAPGHAEELERLHGLPGAVVVRNAPLSSWRQGWVAPPTARPLKVVTVGSMFPGRALEMLIRAAKHAHGMGADIQVHIVGSGASGYVQSLRDLIQSVGAEDLVYLDGPVDRSLVSHAYTLGHVGLALYEAADPGNDSLSNKIIETVASGRPVLAGDLPENRRFVDALGVGWLTEVSEDAIAAALVRISRLTDREITELAHHCDRVAGRELRWEAEFAKVLGALGMAEQQMP